MEPASLFETIWSGKVWKDEDHLLNLKNKFLQNLDLQYKSSQHIIDLIAKTTSDTERVQLFKPSFEWTRINDQIIQTFRKCSTLSTKFRESGNQEYKNGNTTKALHAYSLAIVFAPTGSEELGLGFGNRSAAFVAMHEPKLAIRDIEFAVETGISDHLHQKLQDRKEKCIMALLSNSKSQVQDKADLIEERLFFLRTPNPKIQCAEEFVDIGFNENCGRKLIATKDIEAGTVLCVEQPYVTVMDKELEWDLEHCHNCYRQILGGIPCLVCTFAVFCDKSCLNAAMSGSHQYDHLIFPYFHSHEVLHYSDLMSLRIITKTDPVNLYQKFINSGREVESGDSSKVIGFNREGVYESSYHQIYNLFGRPNLTKASKPEDLNDFVSNIFKAFVLSHLLSDLTHFFSLVGTDLSDKEISSFKDFTTSLIFHHLQNIKFNAISFSEIHKIPTSSTTRTISNAFAVGLFPTLSLANHSCSPSAIHIRNAQHCVTSLISIQPIRAGDEITITYGPKFPMKPTLERQCELERKFKFKCTCQACRSENNWSPASIVTNVDEGLDLQLIRSRCPANANCNHELKCTNCLATIMRINSELDKHEAELRDLYAVIKEYENKLLENSTRTDEYWATIEKLKLCLQFFGSHFKPTFNLTQIGQDLFKKVVVYCTMSKSQ